MVLSVFFQFVATVRALIFVSTGIDITDADGCLNAPSARKNPMITVGKSGTHHPSFEAVILELPEVGAAKFEVCVEVAQAVSATQQVRPDEVAIKAFA